MQLKLVRKSPSLLAPGTDVDGKGMRINNLRQVFIVFSEGWKKLQFERFVILFMYLSFLSTGVQIDSIINIIWWFLWPKGLWALDEEVQSSITGSSNLGISFLKLALVSVFWVAPLSVFHCSRTPNPGNYQFGTLLLLLSSHDDGWYYGTSMEQHKKENCGWAHL